ncbi:MAG TPA: hypothetical protein VER32_14685 [Pyrinomonadaceae bacterium]|nr:hypothetical protein [Pyrinomonadaceae bacterium]
MAATVTDSAVGGDASARRAPSRAPSADEVASRVREEMGDEWPPEIYRERVLKSRTRSHAVLPAAKGAGVEVQHTLLGVELKVGRRRLACPDFATGRYLAVFARAGLAETAVPYDITRVSRLADELESSWQRAMLLAAHFAEGRTRAFQSKARSAVAARIKRELEEAGAGEARPQFKQDTRQGLYRAPKG